MTDKKTADYGSWKSPITPELLTKDIKAFGGVSVDQGLLYWLEMRPEEGGRYVIVRRERDGSFTDVMDAPFNARTRVHEYGGGSWFVHDGSVYFTHFPDQRLYRAGGSGEPEPITPEGPYRYADFEFDSERNRIFCVREDHGVDEEEEPINLLVSLDPDSASPGTEIASGRDFYSSPRLSPDGSRLAFLTWDHPDMPWDRTKLHVATLDGDGGLKEVETVIGSGEESILEPRWSPGGSLYFASDRSNWWNLYRKGGEGKDEVEQVYSEEAEFAVPHWQFGNATYDFVSSETILSFFTKDGTWHAGIIDVNSNTISPIDLPYTSLDSNLLVEGNTAYFSGASPEISSELVEMDLSGGEPTVIEKSTELELDSGYLSVPESIEFETGEDADQTAYGLFYPPKNRDYEGPDGEKPPLLVHVHGGPTGSVSPSFNLGVQFWTSRGIGILHLNYRGSTGYGREFRQALYGNWGVHDVVDSVNGAQYLCKRGDADPDRLSIRGGSAGGYTTMCAVAFEDTFHAGGSHFGVSDLSTFVKITHKFESRYLEKLVGPYPKKKELYEKRSPINYVDQITTPMIFFQGKEDRVVPYEQAETVVEDLKERGVPVAYLLFDDEQHGFRKSENIQAAVKAELSFYGQIYGFEPADDLEPVEIYNLSS